MDEFCIPSETLVITLDIVNVNWYGEVNGHNGGIALIYLIEHLHLPHLGPVYYTGPRYCSMAQMTDPT